MYGIDLSPLFWLAILGAVCLFAILFPAIGAGVGLVLCRLITTEWWGATWAAIGAGIGLIPGILIGGNIIYYWVRG